MAIVTEREDAVIHPPLKRRGLPCRVSVNQIDEVIGRRPEVQGHSGLTDHLASVGAKHRDTHDAARRAFEYHFDHAMCITNGSDTRHLTHGNSITLTDNSGCIRFLIGHAHDRDLGLGYSEAYMIE
jgi:hypothetical protein